MFCSFYFCTKIILFSVLLQLFLTFKSLICSFVRIMASLLKISYVIKEFLSKIFIPLSKGSGTPLFPLESMCNQLTAHEIYT